ncbi:MAG: 2Fe-2S iron-sulfur cluster binding domain-containing protein [Candidatus Daviesbacteria bacterium]|nr:2Fe-2S iron-sulfur cluster binding domain-containing protein [Candidatus Daviesbacteria bacterium]
MAKIIFSDTEKDEQKMGNFLTNSTGNRIKEINVKDKEPIKDACEKLGVPFSCTEGICGTCMIEIVDGQENLSELTQEEKDMGRDKKHRLACQCKIKSGVVKIKY